MVSADTLAVVAATAVGPIIAVGITLWYTKKEDRRRETKAEQDAIYDRRFGVFRTLMATRRVGISPDHVNALNLIEVDFYDCPKVETAWKVYKDHLFSKDDDRARWDEVKERRLATLLFEIAVLLGFNIPALDIFKGGYAPEGWNYRDQLQFGVLEYFKELRDQKNVLPLWVHGVAPAGQQQLPEQAE